ncbi:retinol dehydrogenase 12 [Melanomma pulvis-pyrius CBS 109.77]|uniref:Retinol dehydrogenase 12 n=1 Tax=Melanomma pulvis-pyrius CBS 109.77 TaxID=1314802 RepID=A0A6A6WQ18_9PLEO|nr:retinol dehydrogenase 12 [Melanomma pulvis-pyrius CBS 109.77]
MATPMTWPQLGRQLLYSQFFVRIPPPYGDFSGQTVIVTGSNTGLGFEAARHLLRLKAAKVILAVRSLAKGEAAAEELVKLTSATKNAIEVMPLDLLDPDSIKKFSDWANRLEKLDAVISNAGMLTQQWSTVNGMEAQIAVNVVYATLLGLLLLPKSRASAKKHNARGRIAFVSSDAHYVAQVKEANSPGSLFNALNNRDIAVMEDRYSTSKLFLLYAIREIAGRSPVTPDSNVIVDVLTPGMCHSGLFRDDKPWLHSLIEGFMMHILARSTATGGGALVDAVRTDLPLEAHGAYLMDCKIAENGPNVESEKGQALQKRFIQELFEKMETIAPGITEVL